MGKEEGDKGEAGGMGWLQTEERKERQSVWWEGRCCKSNTDWLTDIRKLLNIIHKFWLSLNEIMFHHMGGGSKFTAIKWISNLAIKGLSQWSLCQLLMDPHSSHQAVLKWFGRDRVSLPSVNLWNQMDFPSQGFSSVPIKFQYHTRYYSSRSSGTPTVGQYKVFLRMFSLA